MNLSLVLSIISILVVITNFILSILDRGKKSEKENHQELIEYQIKEIKSDIKEIKDILIKNQNEAKKMVNEALDLHVKMYHGGA